MQLKFLTFYHPRLHQHLWSVRYAIHRHPSYLNTIHDSMFVSSHADIDDKLTDQWMKQLPSEWTCFAQQKKMASRWQVRRTKMSGRCTRMCRCVCVCAYVYALDFLELRLWPVKVRWLGRNSVLSIDLSSLQVRSPIKHSNGGRASIGSLWYLCHSTPHTQHGLEPFMHHLTVNFTCGHLNIFCQCLFSSP